MSESLFTEEEKKDYLNDWKESGLSRAEYCRDRCLSPSTFQGWVRKYLPEEVGKLKKKGDQGFVKLSGKESSLSMDYRGARIYFPMASLSSVLSTLQSING